MIKCRANGSTILNAVLLYDCCVRSFQNHYETCFVTAVFFSGGEGVEGIGIFFTRGNFVRLFCAGHSGAEGQ